MVGHDKAASGSLLRQRQLRLFAAIEFALIPTPGLDAGEASFERGIHEDDRIAFLINAGFQQQRGIDHGDRNLATSGIGQGCGTAFL